MSAKVIWEGVDGGLRSRVVLDVQLGRSPVIGVEVSHATDLLGDPIWHVLGALDPEKANTRQSVLERALLSFNSRLNDAKAAGGIL